MNQEMQNVASAIMYTAMMHDKKQEEIEDKARKYDELKVAVGKIKGDIKEWYWDADKQAVAKDPCVVDAMIDMFIRTINKHTEGLI